MATRNYNGRHDYHKSSPAEIIAHWDAVSRLRALSEEESLLLERAIHAEQRMAGMRVGTQSSAWLPHEDELLMRCIDDGLSFGQAAQKVGRSRHSCASRFQRLIGSKIK